MHSDFYTYVNNFLLCNILVLWQYLYAILPFIDARNDFHSLFLTTFNIFIQ